MNILMNMFEDVQGLLCKLELNLILIPEVTNCQVTLTAQRGDNGLCHSIDNCEAYCCHCNSSSH